jgi:3-oxoacyl-[acyl-carrier-protein] synthase II
MLNGENHTAANPIVITGMGVISALGVGKESNLRALVEGRSGVAEPMYLPTSHKEFPVGEVKKSNAELAALLGLRPDDHLSRNAVLGMVAAREAAEEAGLSVHGTLDPASATAGQAATPTNRRNGSDLVALVAGSTVGGMDVTERYYPDRLDATVLSQHPCGASTNLVARYLGFVDFATTVSTACSSALNALILAARLLECGEADIVVAGGMESLTLFHLNGFKSLMILDSQPCRPFDADRAGLNLGEGAGFLIMETLDHALDRGAQPLAVLSGTGNACDAYHQTASSPEGIGAQIAMRQALDEAGLKPEAIQYVNAHGTGTPNNDSTESAALRVVFGEHLPAVSSTKGFTGHTTSASGAIEAVFSILALQHQFIPANVGWRKADADCLSPYMGPAKTATKQGQPTASTPSDSTPTTPLEPSMAAHPRLLHVVCNAFGFGGNDSSIVLSLPDALGSACCCTAATPAQPRREGQPAPRPIYVLSDVSEVSPDDQARYLNPRRTRRFSPLMKRALATALKALEEAHIEQPDAIINGTDLGSIDETEQMLDALTAEGEEASTPTLFMQSTHNTIASLVAIYTHNHGYNSTYSQGRESFESALFDAFVQLRAGRLNTALVMVNDTLTDRLRALLSQWGIAGADQLERSRALVLSTTPGDHPLTELKRPSLWPHTVGNDRQPAQQAADKH